VAINGAAIAALSPLFDHVLMRDYGSDWHGFRRRSGLDVEAVTVANAAFADGHSAAVPVFSIAAGDRKYACWASSKDGYSGSVFVSGGSGDVQAELSGTCSVATGTTGQSETRLSLSGIVSGAGAHHNVDRVFAFGVDTKLDSEFRQVVAWVDSLVAK
jgi:prepilin-type processing-associated H-X9-DG protein